MVSQEGYKFSFDASRCATCEGNCCIGESGYIWCTPREIDAMAAYVKLSRQDFMDEYILKVKYKRSLKEKQVGESYHCIFFDKTKNGCQIYPVRPSQCRTFPFWNHFKENIEEVVQECPGIII
ncbi:MAG: YkgJ family cysteine cluster protein [Epsilonproteobacteria bacterium]|nr:YkgJ family cysteine cluster protein [Campylobacterota bacterium]